MQKQGREEKKNKPEVKVIPINKLTKKQVKDYTKMVLEQTKSF